MGDPRGSSRSRTLRRRAVALALAIGATAGLWLLLFGSGEDARTGAPEGERDPRGPAAELAAELPLEELADQVLLLGFEGSDGSSPFLASVRARQLGGVLVDRQNWPDAATGTALVDELRAAGRGGERIPPLIVTAQEGGPYRALGDLPPEQTELEVGDAGSVAGAEAWSLATAEALVGAGIDLNLFPVADVATLDSAVADRAFSDDPALAAQLTAAAVRGCRAAELACAPLHFPGLGAASQDTNRGPATVSLDPEALAGRDLEAFRAAFAERVRAVVLSLAVYAAYDPVTPGALAAPVATGLLRDELGFEGLAITDDLGAGAVRAGLSAPKAAVMALGAGADLVQIGAPEDQLGVHEEILAAVASGELAEARLREAAARVLALKLELGLLERR